MAHHQMFISEYYKNSNIDLLIHNVPVCAPNDFINIIHKTARYTSETLNGMIIAFPTLSF